MNLKQEENHKFHFNITSYLFNFIFCFFSILVLKLDSRYLKASGLLFSRKCLPRHVSLPNLVELYVC